MIHAQLICDAHTTWSVEQVCTSKLSMCTQQNGSWLVCWGLHTWYSVPRRALSMPLVKSPQDPCRWRNREKEGGGGLQREAVVSSSAPHSWWAVGKVGVTQAHRHSTLDWRAEEGWQPLLGVTPLPSRSKANPSLSAAPRSSSSQAPWWHQPCFCNYLTSVVQISNEPARVTNPHISPEKLSTHQTGGQPSAVNSAFRSLFGLYLGEDCTKSNIRCP